MRIDGVFAVTRAQALKDRQTKKDIENEREVATRALSHEVPSTRKTPLPVSETLLKIIREYRVAEQKFEKVTRPAVEGKHRQSPLKNTSSANRFLAQEIAMRRLEGAHVCEGTRPDRRPLGHD